MSVQWAGGKWRCIAGRGFFLSSADRCMAALKLSQTAQGREESRVLLVESTGVVYAPQLKREASKISLLVHFSCSKVKVVGFANQQCMQQWNPRMFSESELLFATTVQGSGDVFRAALHLAGQRVEQKSYQWKQSNVQSCSPCCHI